MNTPRTVLYNDVETGDYDFRVELAETRDMLSVLETDMRVVHETLFKMKQGIINV